MQDIYKSQKPETLPDCRIKALAFGPPTLGKS